MNKNRALLVAAAIFGIVALFHLIRAIFDWEVLINGFVVPVWLSYFAAIIAGILSLSIYKAIKK